MKRTGIFLFVTVVSFFGNCSAAEYRDLPLTRELINSGITIVDIRTEPEWQETGVVPGSVLLTFFHPGGSYDLEAFIAELKRHIGPNYEVALLCRSGNRSAKAAKLLAGQGFSSVINVTGGIRTAADKGIELVSYPAASTAATSDSEPPR